MNPVARIEIALMPDGKVNTSFAVPSRTVFNLMMETAKQDGVMLLVERERQKVILPDPTLNLQV